MTLDVIIEDERWAAANLDGIAESAYAAVLAYFEMAPGDYEAALLACDDAKIANLNGAFRDKPTPTNVLSWPSEERALSGSVPPVPPPSELGDIAIAYETCAKEAMDQNKTFDAHVGHLLVHGLLHLLGYDHENDADAAIMELKEVEILESMGVSNPY